MNIEVGSDILDKACFEYNIYLFIVRISDR